MHAALPVSLSYLLPECSTQFRMKNKCYGNDQGVTRTTNLFKSPSIPIRWTFKRPYRSLPGTHVSTTKWVSIPLAFNCLISSSLLWCPLINKCRRVPECTPCYCFNKSTCYASMGMCYQQQARDRSGVYWRIQRGRKTNVTPDFPVQPSLTHLWNCDKI